MSSNESPTRGPYRRVILKLSGESFGPPGERGISMQEVVHIARQTKAATEQGVQRSSSAAATSFAVANLRPATRAFRKRLPITWECSPPLSTGWLCKMP